MNRFIFIFVLLIISGSLYAQMDKNSFTSKDSLYNENIKKSRLYGVYIPRDIPDALQKLMELTTDEARAKLKNADEQTVAKRLFFGLGRWMDYNWNFAEGSRFSHYLRKKGLFDTDDMVTFMLISFHRHVNNKPLDSDALIQHLVDERIKKMEEEKKKREQITILPNKREEDK